MDQSKYYRLDGFGFYRDGQAWVRVKHLPPVIAGGPEDWKISLVIRVGNKHYTHTFRTAFSSFDDWYKTPQGVLEHLETATGAYGQIHRCHKADYEQACVACCEANQWSNGDIRYVWGTPAEPQAHL